MKEFLSRAAVEFTAKNVDEDLDAYHELVRRGWRTIPVTLVGEHVVHGYDPAALTAALEQLTRDR